VAPIFIGIDVSKAFLDIAYSDGREERIRNTTDEVSAFASKIAALKPQLVAMEASGGFERLALTSLQAAGVPAVAMNPRQVRDFAKARGKLAKTDRIDARVLCEFGRRMEPEVRQARDPRGVELADLMTRRRQLVTMISVEKTRRKQTTNKTIARSIDGLIKAVSAVLKTIDAELDTVASGDSSYREDIELMRTVPGVGKVTALTLRSLLPELGRATRKEVAALAGVAPLANDSGQRDRDRSCWGGRANVRAVLYMAALVAVRCNPTFKAIYAQLRSRGKLAKVALVACMRRLLGILNAMMRTRKPWELAPAPGS
jgi:transposase